MGFMPDVKGMIVKLDERFAALIAKLDEMLVVLREIRAELQDR